MRKIISNITKHILLIILCFLTFYPLLFTIITSFKDNEQFYKSFWSLPNPLVWGNYKDAFTSIMPYVVNSLLVSFLSILFILIISSLSAYAFARISFPFKEFIFTMIIALLMIPGILTLIPRYMLMKNFHLLDTYSSLIFNYVAGGQAFAIFVIRSFLEGQPKELFEAARIDGSNEFQAFTKIAVPLCKPILGTVAITNLLGIWNDYLWPMIVLSGEEKYTISLGLLKYQSTIQGAVRRFGPEFAGYVVASLPLIILFFILMDQFLEGMTAGAIKA